MTTIQPVAAAAPRRIGQPFTPLTDAELQALTAAGLLNLTGTYAWAKHLQRNHPELWAACERVAAVSGQHPGTIRKHLARLAGAHLARPGRMSGAWVIGLVGESNGAAERDERREVPRRSARHRQRVTSQSPKGQQQTGTPAAASPCIQKETRVTKQLHPAKLDTRQVTPTLPAQPASKADVTPRIPHPSPDLQGLAERLSAAGIVPDAKQWRQLAKVPAADITSALDYTSRRKAPQNGRNDNATAYFFMCLAGRWFDRKPADIGEARARRDTGREADMIRGQIAAWEAEPDWYGKAAQIQQARKQLASLCPGETGAATGLVHLSDKC